MKRLSQEAITVLGSMTVDQGKHTAVITAGQLDRGLYVEVNKTLEALGGKWNKKLKAHVFDGDPEDAIDQVVLSGGFIDAKKEFGFFETPEKIADQLVRLAEIKDESYVLEPSAGRGRLFEAIIRANPECAVTMIEQQPKLYEALCKTYPRGHDAGFRVRVNEIICADFLKWWRPKSMSTADCLKSGPPPFDTVVMNPPFAKQADIEHVEHAFGLLRSGGTLAAIMSAGVKFRQNKKATAFRQRVGLYGTMTDLPDGAFQESGTGVQTVMVRLVKP